MGIFDFFKSEKEKKFEEKQRFRLLSDKDKMSYLSDFPKTKIYSFVERQIKLLKEKSKFNTLSNSEKIKYFKDFTDELKYENSKSGPHTDLYNFVNNQVKPLRLSTDIKLFKDLIKIDGEMSSKFDSSFFEDITSSSLEEKSNLICEEIKEKNVVRTYVKLKIKFITLTKSIDSFIFCVDSNLITSNRSRFADDEIEVSSGDNFTDMLTKALNNLEKRNKPNYSTSYPKVNISRKKFVSIHLKTLIKIYIIENHDKIIGCKKVIERINQVFIKYRDMQTKELNNMDGRYMYGNSLIKPSESLTNDRQDLWDFKFFDKNEGLVLGINVLKKIEEVISNRHVNNKETKDNDKNDVEIFLTMENTTFFYGEDEEFEAMELRVEMGDYEDGENDFIEFLKEAFNCEHLVFTETENIHDEFELKRIIELPEIEDYDVYGDGGSHGPFRNRVEAFVFLNKLKTISFKSFLEQQ